MRRFEMMQDLQGYDQSLKDYLEGHMMAVRATNPQDLFMTHLGGHVIMVETKEEFEKILRDYGTEPDMFRQLDFHVVYGYITNNSGGPMFFIHNDLYDEVKDIQQ